MVCALMHRGLIKREGGDVLGDRCALLIKLIIKLMIKLLGEVEIEQEAVEGSACFDELIKGGAEGHALNAWDQVTRLSTLERADKLSLAIEMLALLLVKLIKEVAQGGVGHRDLVALCI